MHLACASTAHLEAVLSLPPHGILRLRVRPPQAAAEVHVVGADPEGLITARHDAAMRHQLIRGEAVVRAAVTADHGVYDHVISDRIEELVLIRCTACGLGGTGP